MERNEKCFCGSGRKYKNCHYRINGESKLSNIYRKIYEYDKYCNEHGLCNMCDKNCSKCCSDYFYVDEMEFLTILEYMIHNKEFYGLNFYRTKILEQYGFDIVQK